MDAGILSLLCLVTLFILLSTGWFLRLIEELKWTNRQVRSGLLAMIATLELPSLPEASSIQVHPLFIALLVLFWLFARRVSRLAFLSQVSVSLFVGSLFFLWHEITHVDTLWQDPIFRLMIVTTLLLLSLIWKRTLSEQLFFNLGSLFVVHCWVLFFHHDMIQPLIIGNEEYLDTVCLVLVGTFFLHELAQHVGEKESSQDLDSR